MGDYWRLKGSSCPRGKIMGGQGTRNASFEVSYLEKAEYEYARYF